MDSQRKTVLLLLFLSSCFYVSAVYPIDKKSEYRKKLTSSADSKLLIEFGCLSCHTTDGSRSIGPSFVELSKGKVKIVTEDKKVKEINVDADYIRRAIIEPNSEVVQGFRRFSMPEQKRKIKKNDLEKLVKLLTP